MIDSSPAIEKVKNKIIYVRVKGCSAVISDGKNKEGKWHIIDMVFGSINQAIDELKEQGYIVRSF